jgi:hypothetical protein
MGACVFIGLATEWASLCHRNEPFLILKFPFPVLIVGPAGSWSVEGAEYSWRLFSAIGVDVDGTEEAGSTSERAH